MTILEIYSKYNIPQNLQEHMLRVAAVGSIVCDYLKGEDVDKNIILSELLLHDMGNIIKFSFDGPLKLSGEEVDELKKT